MPRYRIREARVEVCNGHRCWYERRFGAERRVSLFGVLAWWWPVVNFQWRQTAEAASKDAEQDASLRVPLSNDQYVEFR